MELADVEIHARELWLDGSVVYNGTAIIDARIHGITRNGHAFRRFIEVSVDDLPNPSYRDTFRVEGEDWKVFQTSDDHDGEPKIKDIGNYWLIPLFSNERPNAPWT